MGGDSTVNDALRDAERLLRDAASPPPAPLAGRAIVRRMSDVRPREIDWLWPGWLARGKLHLLGGHPGDGKSTLTAWLAARLSRPGQTFPDGAPAPPAVSLFLLAEDALDDTFRPRLDAMGADAERVLALEAVRDEATGREAMFSLNDHVPLLEAAIRETGAALVVIDPLSSFLPGRDRNAEGDVRDALTPLGKLAEASGAAVLGVMHVGKAQQRTATQSLLGSTGFGAIARAVWLVAADPDDESGERKALGVVKSNIARKPAPLLWSRPDDGPLRWHGAASRPMEAIFGADHTRPRDDAEGFLRETLKGGSRPALEMMALAKAAGFSEATLRRAAAAIPVEKRKERSVGGRWLWSLPAGQPRRAESSPFDSGPKALTPRDAQVSAFDSSQPDAKARTPADGARLPTPPKALTCDGGMDLHIPPKTFNPASGEHQHTPPKAFTHEGGARLGGDTPSIEDAHLGISRGEPLRGVPDGRDGDASRCVECGRPIPPELGGRACLAHGGVPADPLVAQYVRVLAEFTPEELVAYRAELANPPPDDPPSAAEFAALAIVAAAREPA